MGPFIPRSVGGLESGLTHTPALAFIPRDMVGHDIGHELGSSDLGGQLVVWVTLPRLRARCRRHRKVPSLRTISLKKVPTRTVQHTMGFRPLSEQTDGGVQSSQK